jgi:hypothetical protein
MLASFRARLNGQMASIAAAITPRVAPRIARPLGLGTIEHASFAATDNAAFMAEGVPNLIMLQDESVYFTVHHTIGDTFDKADPRDFATFVATLASATYAIADKPTRFGRRLNADEVKKMAAESKVDKQWRAAAIW